MIRLDELERLTLHTSVYKLKHWTRYFFLYSMCKYFDFHYPYIFSSSTYEWILDCTLDPLFFIELINDPGSTFDFGTSSSSKVLMLK
jgi:hypothetical protein